MVADRQGHLAEDHDDREPQGAERPATEDVGHPVDTQAQPAPADEHGHGEGDDHDLGPPRRQGPAGSEARARKHAAARVAWLDGTIRAAVVRYGTRWARRKL